jgi:hypothetical protein
MTGYMYIAGSFHNVSRSQCGRGADWVDNDPHFWTTLPTWGICRPDLRERVEEDDVVFFVLPLASRHPQMVFGYLTVDEIITHAQAFSRQELRSKRMGNKNPNGNIIVDSRGRYNRYDAGMHEANFDRIRHRYVIGDPRRSQFLGASKIRRLAPQFLETLCNVIGRTGDRVVDIVSRYGRTLSAQQTQTLIEWLA